MRRYVSRSSRLPIGVRHFTLPVDPDVTRMEYAVRGPIVARAELYDDAIRAGERFIIDPETKEKRFFTFEQVLMCNVGNPLAMGQRPLTFPREVISLIYCPHPSMREGKEGPFSDESRARSRRMIYGMGGWNRTGAYSVTKGLSFVRKSVADFITRRDGVPADVENIYLVNGASTGIEMTLAALDGSVLIPVPRYPLYSAALTALGRSYAGYELDEAAGWSVSAAQLDRCIAEAAEKGVSIKALVVINPGNPTGQVLTRETMTEIAELCSTRRLLLLADEVYQENAYTRPFVSFYSVCSAMGASSPQLISYHSTSKGYYGECGFRGGYMQFHAVDGNFKSEVAKVASTHLCPGVPGQLMMDLMTDEPPLSTDAGRLHAQEKADLAASMARRAKTLVEKLNGYEGIHCNAVEGAMYAFPTIELPTKFKKLANERGLSDDRADELWAQMLLDETGITTVPGSGFGQKAGTNHIRLTILPPENIIELVATRIGEFHEGIRRQFAS